MIRILCLKLAVPFLFCLISLTVGAIEVSAAPSGTKRLWRLWNPVNTDHFYTASERERELAVTKHGYRIESEIIYVHTRRGDGRVPLRRYWNAQAGDHFYTTLGGGRPIDGYKYEGIAAWVYNTPGDNRVRLYRHWSGTNTDHFYTTLNSSVPGYAHEYWENIWVYDNFDVYNFYYKEYSASNNELPALRQWSNTAVASSPEQVRLAVQAGFSVIVYRYNPNQEVVRNLAVSTSSPEFRKAFFIKNKQVLDSLKKQLNREGLYKKIRAFYIADEPALHRDIYKDQRFLDDYTLQVKRIMSGKKIWVVFAQILPHSPHFSVPKAVDVVLIDPYLWNYNLAPDQVHDYLYNHPNSSINWALQWRKPIILVGDAMIRADQELRVDLTRSVYNVARAEPAIRGLAWFVYDKGFVEGTLRGTSTNPDYVDQITSLRGRQ